MTNMTPDEFKEHVQCRDSNSRLDRFGKEFLKSDKFTVRIAYKGEENLSWTESYLGTKFGSTVDYGKRAKQLQNGELTEAELEQEVQKRVLRGCRYIDLEEDDGVVTGVVAIVHADGYAIYPDPEQII